MGFPIQRDFCCSRMKEIVGNHFGGGVGGSEISSYLQVDEVVSCSFVDASRRHKTLGPETKDSLLLKATAEARVSGSTPVL